MDSASAVAIYALLGTAVSHDAQKTNFAEGEKHAFLAFIRTYDHDTAAGLLTSEMRSSGWEVLEVTKTAVIPETPTHDPALSKAYTLAEETGFGVVIYEDIEA